ncbi:cation transporter [Roseomonas sp. SSH11]|uniref:Cation transporter n=1 Tax=Pararoseomonas baculiformis TaxID=2820812 RepID=A0ABS4AM02_9PROT|nr:cation transporter [Pararoseomonas baculiformis]
MTAAELVGGIVSGSLSLLANAAHNLSNAGSVLVSYVAWRISRRAADRRRTFGYGRAEMVGALINLTTLIVIGLYLVYEAGRRFLDPGEVAGTTMLVVGVVALAEDAAAAWVLRRETGSLSVRSTYLHMIADALATLDVILGAVAIIIWGTAAWWVDPAATAAIALYVLVHGTREMRSVISVLMDSAPRGFDYDGLVAELRAAPGVRDLRHLHVWQPAEGKIALQIHLVLGSTDLHAATATKEQLKKRLRERFGISHATIEVEAAGCVAHDPALFVAEWGSVQRPRTSGEG